MVVNEANSTIGYTEDHSIMYVVLFLDYVARWYRTSCPKHGRH